MKESDQRRLSSEGGLADAAPCRNFAKAGWCAYGERCWYSHKPSIQPNVTQKRKIAGQAPVAVKEVPPPIDAKPPNLDQQRADQVKEEGNVLYRDGNYEEAISRYTSAIGSSPLGTEHVPHSILQESTMRSLPITPTGQQHTFPKESFDSLSRTVRRREPSNPPNPT
jgi:hypothetical protein